MGVGPEPRVCDLLKPLPSIRVNNTLVAKLQNIWSWLPRMRLKTKISRLDKKGEAKVFGNLRVRLVRFPAVGGKSRLSGPQQMVGS